MMTKKIYSHIKVKNKSNAIYSTLPPISYSKINVWNNVLNVKYKNSFSPWSPKEEMDRKRKREYLRNKAYRKLKGKVPPGWKLRVGTKRKKFFINGIDPSVLNEDNFESKHFITATKYMGEKGEKGYPYIKCFLHPSAGFTWSLSNWSRVENFHKCAHFMLSVNIRELNQVSMCMEALRDLMEEDPLVEMKGTALSSSIEKWNSNAK